MNGHAPIRKVLADALQNNDRVHILGEAIELSPATRGLTALAPDRVHLLPAADAGLVGVAVGMAMGGAVPVVELAGPEALWAAAAQLGAEAALLAGDFAGSLVVRVPLAPGQEAPLDLLSGMPHLTVAAGASAPACAALLASALRARGPVVLFESADALAVETDETPTGLGTARALRSGSQLTFLGFGAGTVAAQSAAAALAEDGVSAEVLDLGTAWPLDTERVRAHVHETGRPVVVGAPAAVLQAVTELGFLRLEAPPVSVPANAGAAQAAGLRAVRY